MKYDDQPGMTRSIEYGRPFNRYMPTRYLIEMFCDRVAASKIYQGKNYTEAHPLEYFSRAKTRIIMHPKTAQKLERLLVMLKEKGEKETFAYIRKMK